MTASNRLSPNFPVAIICMWILTGALFKLLAGTPADLPPVVREVPLDLGLTYKLVIAIELGIVAVGLLRPRVGWVLLAAQMAVFLGVLATQVGSGNCGCFGSKIKVSPWAMLTIDGVLLLWLLATRPWMGFRALVTPAIALVPLTVLLFGAPFMLDREAEAPLLPADETLRVEVADRTGADGTDTDAAEVERSTPAPPEASNDYAILRPEKWAGQTLEECELVPWIEGGPDAIFPGPGTWILWRQSCDHCAEHLEELTLNDDGSVFYTLIQVPDDLEQEPVVHLKPQGDHVFETKLIQGPDYVVQTPVEAEFDGVAVTHAREVPADEH